MDDALASFPYVNDGLFADENIEIPRFNENSYESVSISPGTQVRAVSFLRPKIYEKFRMSAVFLTTGLLQYNK